MTITTDCDASDVVRDCLLVANLERIVDRAETADVFVWIDIEDHTTDATLDAYERFATRYEDGVGLCLQANLKRTRDDLARLETVPGKVRLVKGAYDEPKSIAYTDKSRIDDTSRTLIEDAFANRDGGIVIGSHDPAKITYARQLHEEYGTPFEVQMLMGPERSTADPGRRRRRDVPVRSVRRPLAPILLSPHPRA